MLKPVASSSSPRHVPVILRDRAPDTSGAIIAVKVNALKFEVTRFSYVRYEKITRNPIEGEAPWIAQAIGPNLAQAASADERIIRRHTVVAIRSSLPNQVSRFWPLPFGSPQQPPAPNEVYELLSPGTSRHTSTCLCMAHLGFAIETFAFVFTGGKTSGCEKPAGVSGAFEVAVAVAFGALVTRIRSQQGRHQPRARIKRYGAYRSTDTNWFANSVGPRCWRGTWPRSWDNPGAWDILNSQHRRARALTSVEPLCRGAGRLVA